MNILFRYSFILALSWLIIASILFCLPGSALPKAGWMQALQVDKWVHVGIFSLLCFFWGITLNALTGIRLLFLFLAAVAYGILVEVVQDKLIVNRSFDVWDVVADGVGAALGLWGGRWIRYTKK